MKQEHVKSITLGYEFNNALKLALPIALMIADFTTNEVSKIPNVKNI